MRGLFTWPRSIPQRLPDPDFLNLLERVCTAFARMIQRTTLLFNATQSPWATGPRALLSAAPERRLQSSSPGMEGRLREGTDRLAMPEGQKKSAAGRPATGNNIYIILNHLYIYKFHDSREFYDNVIYDGQ